jgi:hypothetical protein
LIREPQRWFIHPEDATPSVVVTPIQLVAPVQFFGQHRIRHAILAKATARTVTWLFYATQKFGTAQRCQLEIPFRMDEIITHNCVSHNDDVVLFAPDSGNKEIKRLTAWSGFPALAPDLARSLGDKAELGFLLFNLLSSANCP